MRRAFLLLFLTFTLCGQTDEEQPYFSLSSQRTFGPGEKATVELSAVDVAALDFRVYRVNDPVAFFGKLDDFHQFGGQAPRPERNPTPLEQFHRFKRRWHARMYNTFREQFSPATWTQVKSFNLLKTDGKESGVTNFAAAPLLNTQQVVATWRQKVQSEGRWRGVAIPIDVKREGVYLVEAASKSDLRAYTILMISSIGIVTKSYNGQTGAFVANRQTGEPVADCTVTVQHSVRAKATVSPAKTNPQGLVRFTAQAAEGDDEPILLARLGDSFAATSLPGFSRYGQNQDTTGLAYTDRPVYRPGHPVHFRAILRSRNGNLYRLPELRNVDVEIQGPDEKTIYRKQLPVSPMGTVAGDLTVPPEAGLGYYSIAVKADGTDVRSGFQVEEYKKPEYEVRVSLAKARVLQGETVNATVDARYFFGEPVANAKLHYVIFRSRDWSGLFHRQEDNDDNSAGAGESDGDGTSSDFENEQLSDEEAKLDADGKFNIKLTPALNENRYDMRYRIEARVTDAGNREISGTGYLLATYGSFSIDVETEQYFVQPKADAKFQVQTKAYDGSPVETTVTVDLVPWVWNHGVDQDGPPLVHTEVRTGANGEAPITLNVPKSGNFRLRVRATTPENRVVQSYTTLWVSGEEGGFAEEGRSKRIQIISDKRSYRPGDTAKLLILAGVPQATILVSEEGRSLGAMRLLKVSGGKATLELPVTEASSPDFYVGISFWKDNEFHQGTKAIHVPASDRHLSLELTPSKKQFVPGETASYTLLAKDSAGSPVAGEFSLGVVDEAIYGVQPDSTPDIFRTFYGPSYNAVTTSSSANFYFNGEAGKRRMQLASLHRKRALAQLKPDRLVQPKIRKLFPDTAFWMASLNTDSQGRGTAQFAFPDSITTWRATVRGITANSRVGSTVQKTIVRKNVILRMVAPRFFSKGDEITISAVVHNYLADAKQAKVSLEVKGLETVEAGTKDVTLPSRGETKVDWRVRASAIGNATVTMKALTNEESDAVEMTLPINAQGVKTAIAYAGSLNAAKTGQMVNLQFPAASVPETRNLEIVVSPSVAGALFGAIDYLTQFPYGCTEQTLSSFVPNITVNKALHDLGIQTDVNDKVLALKIRAGLERLHDFQHPDGGWGWWKTDDSSIFMTTAAVAGLGQAKAAGQTIPGDAIQNGVKWLRAAYGTDQNLTPDLRAYAAWALATAGMPDAKITADVRSKEKGLTSYGVALLGLTYLLSNDKAEADKMAGLLERSANQNAAEAWWPGDRDTLMDFYADVTPEVTAFALKLLVAVRPQSPLLEKSAVWLMNHRQDGSFWYSTKQTAMVIYGLTDYLKATGELKPNLTATVTANGKALLSKHFQAADALSPEINRIVIPADAANSVQFSMQGTGRVYWSVRGNYFSTEQRLVKAGTVGLNILRDYFLLKPVTEKGNIVYDLDPLAGPLAVGDILAVRITVTGTFWKYLLVEDPIPAGAEFVEKSGLYNLKQQPVWWNTLFARREMHNDRLALFDTYFPSGQRQYTYLLKIVNPGKFQVSPAIVQPMYQPEFLATTEPKQVEVK